MFKRTAVPPVGPSKHQARQPLNMALGFKGGYLDAVMILLECENPEELRQMVRDLHNAVTTGSRVLFSAFPVMRSENGRFSMPPVSYIVKPHTPRQDIVATMQKCIADDLTPDDELIIVDPYFFSPRSLASYADLILEILSPFAGSLLKLSIVTLPGKEVDRALVASVRTKLRNAYPNLRMKTFTSRSFHDRFWVNAKGRKAFVSGTSLNGLGRKYALLASLSDADTLDVIAALRDEQVI